MSSLDVDLQTLVYYRLLPLFILIILLGWLFKIDLNRKNFNALFQYCFLGLIHGRLDREKRLLFDQLTQKNEQNTRSSVRYNTQLLEIGVGTNRNIDFYPKGTVFTCIDPNPYHKRYVEKAMQTTKNKFVRLAEFIEGFAEDMSVFSDNSFDIVVCTLTLCSVKNQIAALREIQRVLKPGGKFYFLEHVAAKKGSFGRWIQDKLDYIQPYLFDGCHINLETWLFFDRVNFKTVNYREFSAKLLPIPGFYLPCIYGTAEK